jgi:hypothetical protein
MLRRRVIAVLLALSSAAALTLFELLGSPLYLTLFRLPLFALLIGLGLAGLHELVHPGAPITVRVRRIRGSVYLWQAANATVSVAHSRTQNLAELTRQADVLVVAAGQPRMIGAEHVRPGAVVVDVGIHRKPEGGLCGDVRYEEVEPIAAAITPVPGGVGPMTVTLLLVNTVASWCQRCGLDQPLADLLP